MSEEFKKEEGLAQKIIDILIENYYHRDKTKSKIRDKEYLNIIEWGIKDYESHGFNMEINRTYIGIKK